MAVVWAGGLHSLGSQARWRFLQWTLLNPVQLLVAGTGNSSGLFLKPFSCLFFSFPEERTHLSERKNEFASENAKLETYNQVVIEHRPSSRLLRACVILKNVLELASVICPRSEFR